MIEAFFPLGIWHYLIGGLIVGLGISLIFIFTGIIAGASTFYSSTLSFFSGFSYFNKKNLKDSRNWRLFLAFGLILGGFVFTFFINNGKFFVTEVSWIRLAIGGLLIGFGTRLSKGCTSGHGICGISQFSLKSFIAVITFLITAIATALIIKSSGIMP